ncbi:hypothetical protein MMC15_006556 [Xylographa vitiligo]|nr:hypothetical protein [Xylographa vitiligo]
MLTPDISTSKVGQSADENLVAGTGRRDHLESTVKKHKAVPTKAEVETKELLMREEQERLASLRTHQQELEREARTDDRQRMAEERAEKPAYEAINQAADAKKAALTLDELSKMAAQNQFAERFNGMIENQGKFVFDSSSFRRPSQTVT